MITEPTPQQLRRAALAKAYRVHRDECDEFAVAAMVEAYEELTGNKTDERFRDALREALMKVFP